MKNAPSNVIGTHAPSLESAAALSETESERRAREWVITLGDGSYAMGTVSGLSTRRYHALLIASNDPPVSRARLVARVHDEVSIGAQTWTLTPMIFVGSDERHTDDRVRLVGFEQAPGRCTWRFELFGPDGRVAARIERVFRGADGEHACELSYTCNAPNACSLRVIPLLAMHDFHELHAPGSISIDDLDSDRDTESLVVRRAEHNVRIQPSGFTLRRDDPCVWKNFVLIEDRSRGQDCVEDLYAPCTLGATIAPDDVSPRRVRFSDASVDGPIDFNAHDVSRGARLDAMRAFVEKRVGSKIDPETASAITTLVHAADTFVVRRETPIPGSRSIIAGYPWFSDWGRDTMISLEGLLLVTGRLEEARATLEVFASAQQDGLIPNRFDDRSGPTHYNTVDASLWFVHALGRYAHWSAGPVPEALIDAARRVIDAYTKGTRYDIRVDPSDGLVQAGNEETQLTWMDAQRGGVTFTPRQGKAVEINALWIQALRTLATITDDGSERTELTKRADRVQESFERVFGNGPRGGLRDTENDATGVRPNQVFACSLDRVGLATHESRGVVDAVLQSLITPVGVRTLAPDDDAYEALYRGTLMERDRAYHNGTVWPWLLGPYCEARMRASGFSDASRTEAIDRLVTLTNEASRVGAGSIHEIYDADPTPWRSDASVSHRPDGCPAQAWSIAETLRVLVLALTGDR